VTHPIDELLAAYGRDAIIANTPSNPSFTVIVRTQGHRPDSLNEALDAISAQIDTTFDVVVVVHGDTRAVEAVRAAMGSRADHSDLQLRSVDGGGRARPLNTGLDAARGDYICFLDDDDLVMENWLATFAAGARTSPSTVVRAVTLSQEWTTDGGPQPLRATGEIERPFPDRFDLLAHMSLNLTPICSVAFPRVAILDLGIRFDEDLPVYEDWEFLMRAAMALGVTSRTEATSLYRRLDQANADTVEDESVWRATHAAVIDRLSARPVLLPIGDARRLAGTHFQIGGRSRHETDLQSAHTTIDELTRSPTRWLRAYGRRMVAALRHRIAARRP
jgi:glycosyltransferase involved in cell wall biosynthesis